MRSQPGLLSVETLRDIQDHHRYVVLSTVSIMTASIMRRSFLFYSSGRPNNTMRGNPSYHAGLVAFFEITHAFTNYSWLASPQYKSCTAKVVRT